VIYLPYISFPSDSSCLDLPPHIVYNLSLYSPSSWIVFTKKVTAPCMWQLRATPTLRDENLYM